MPSNQVLDTIMQRRSIFRYTSESVPDEKIASILEAGRWAPSYANTQPWAFITVRESKLRREVSEIVRETMAAHEGIETAPVIIVICVDPKKDEYHFIEDGAVATQNMALAAHSLGLSSYWVGIFDLAGAMNSVETKIKRILNIPHQMRVIAILPVGVPAYSAEKTRKALEEICHENKYAGSPSPGAGEKGRIESEAPRHGLKSQLPPITPT